MQDSAGTPLLSVIIPVYRVEAYLERCLDSVLANPDDDIEVIAVNDASPDGCAAILDDYAKLDSRLRVVHRAVNEGLSKARNAGLDHAVGRYVWFVDSDDWLPEGAVKAVNDRLSATYPDVLIIDHAEVYGDDHMVSRSSVDPNRKVTIPIRLSQWPKLLRLAQSACIKVTRRAYLDEMGLRFLPGWYEDSSFSHPLLMSAQRIDLLHNVCYNYRQRTPGGITTTMSARHFEVFDQYERLFEMVDAADGAWDEFRPEIFRVMINHYLVIVGNDWRLPRGMQRAFFKRIVHHYRRWLPVGGYDRPDGVTGLKHRLVRYDAYRAYSVLRLGHRAMGTVRRVLRLGPRPAQPMPVASRPVVGGDVGRRVPDQDSRRAASESLDHANEFGCAPSAAGTATAA